jgi:L-lactate dehydrogenase
LRSLTIHWQNEAQLKKAHSTKISVIGVGHVGSMTGFLLAMRGLATEIVLCARDGTDARAKESQRRAAAEALDIRHAIAFTSHRLEIRAGTSADTRDSDILVIAASEKMPPKADAIRDVLAIRNSALMRRLIPRLAKLSPHAIIVNVANPVDVITYHIHKASGFDWRKVIGTGTLLDTLRFRRRLSDELDVFAGDLRTYIIGEHGPSSVATLSHATIGGTNLGRLVDAMGIHEAMVTEAEQEAKKIGSEIFRTRGYTNYAVAMAVEMIVDSIVRDRSMTLPVSVFLDGFCELDDVCLSLPCVISRRGIKQRLKPELSDDEKAMLRHSAAVIKEVIEKTRESKVVE